MTRTSFAHVYETLKDFQQATVEHVTNRFYGPDPTDRFLVADEVGLGKTLVARGVIARSIEHHLRAGTGRIDVVYICSNGDIARQNIRKLNVLERNDFHLASRITLLPGVLSDLQANRVNFVSFTPGTSFNLRSSQGVARERVLLYHMLRDLWGRHVVRGAGGAKVFAGWSGFRRFRAHVRRWARNHDYDDSLAADFAAQLEQADAASRSRGQPTFVERFEELRQSLAYKHRNKRGYIDPQVADDRARFVGDLRELPARVCVNALEPDLVILDEFQRFKHLLDPGRPEAELAQSLFGYEGAKILLLSATPYKMYTLSEEAGEDHYADLLDTLRFLLDDQAQVEGFARDLRAYRQGLLMLGDGGPDRARRAKERIEATLRGVMARTERLSVTADRRGMLTERAGDGVRLHDSDLRHYLAVEQAAEHLDVGSMLHYWQSTPYPFNFMDGYQVDRKLEAGVETGHEGLRSALGRTGVVLSWQDIEAYRRVDPANTRVRWLLDETVEAGAWRLVWVPPSLPYYELGEAYAGMEGFTKRLVFSAWRVVPTMVAALTSYEAERRMMQARGNGQVRNTPEERNRIRGLLRFTRSSGRLTGMPVLALLYPSRVLSNLGDPRELAAEVGAYHAPADRRILLEVLRRRLELRLRPRLDTAPDTGLADETWYWAAPFLLDLDADPDGTRAWLEDPELAEHFVRAKTGDPIEEDVAGGFAAHLEQARALVRGELEPLGRPPEDLLDVLAEMALAAPGVVAHRALSRLGRQAVGDGPDGGHDLRHHAAHIAWGFRSLFNQPDIMTMIRGGAAGSHREDAYWRLVLSHCLDGCLQAVLDEYVHVLGDSLGLAGQTSADLLDEVTDRIHEAVTLRTVTYAVRDLAVADGQVTVRKPRMRGSFALRFGDQTTDDQGHLARSASVRHAFNSPFHPFLLATTSVGQEGLDFHTYCHAVVHWNLPANPVDLEQREGRVHRYKGHAVRRNVTADHREEAFGGEADPWTGVFAAAAATRGPTDSELIPDWIYRGPARIERHVPALPLSRSARQLEDLKRSLAAYRLVFGQPRQADLVAFLREHADAEELAALADDLNIDLTPAPVAGMEPAYLEPGELAFWEGRPEDKEDAY